MRTIPMVSDCFYHVYNRGVDKRHIFLSDADRRRYLRGCILFNDQMVIPRKPELVIDGSHPHRAQEPLVSIVAYALMDNHVHFVLKQVAEDGVAKFMQRLGTGYTKYFNRKYERTGSLFESTYKAVLIEDETQFLHATRYVHLNPLDLYEPGGNEQDVIMHYRWSSFPHYIGKASDPIIDDVELKSRFSPEEYQNFVLDWIPQRNTLKSQS